MKILYICTHNRCRSILAEAITNQLAQGRIIAMSAGSHPAQQVHPLTLKSLQEKGFNIQYLISKSLDDFKKERPDIVITVCDRAVNEPCPVWLGDSLKLHWGLPDPSCINGSEEEIRDAFYSVIETIKYRVKKMLVLDLEQLSVTELQTALEPLAEEN